MCNENQKTLLWSMNWIELKILLMWLFELCRFWQQLPNIFLYESKYVVEYIEYIIWLSYILKIIFTKRIPNFVKQLDIITQCHNGRSRPHWSLSSAPQLFIYTVIPPYHPIPSQASGVLYTVLFYRAVALLGPFRFLEKIENTLGCLNTQRKRLEAFQTPHAHKHFSTMEEPSSWQKSWN